MQMAVLLAAVVAPAAGVMLIRTLAPNSGPARAAAMVGTEEVVEPVRPPAPPQLSGKQAALASALRGRASEYRSPFVVLTSEAAREGLLQDPRGAQVAKRPEFSITSIVTGTQPMAVINGKARRVGDDMGDGWSLIDIDPTRRQVTVQHLEHGVLVLHIKAGLD